MTKKYRTTLLRIVAGLCVIILALAYYKHSSDLKQGLAHKRLTHPQINDFYHTDFSLLQPIYWPEELLDDHYKYGLLKVEAVTPKNIGVVRSRYTYSTQRHIIKAIRGDKLILEQYFSSQMLWLPRTELAKYFQQQLLYTIDRPIDNRHLYGGIVVLPKGSKRKQRQQQNAQKLNALAVDYYRGEGGVQDFEKAFELFTKAAEMGHSFAQVNLAEMYRDGEGIDQNLDKAQYWFEMAANQGNQTAKQSLKKLHN
ncbi:tetratricopeptide repeat protein [Catenovulum agarivorans]|uniref:tetratricopeptide repeat protein n=1 Tax=Catenovulum agarivorans TaxID=1172192 RepID=UPI0002FB033A|nr:tetratricopeptide repeat protein [Catenovulum agarivorans]